MEYSELDAKLEPWQKPGWSIIGTLRAALRMVRKAAIHTEAGRGGMDELAVMVELRDLLNTTIDTAARHLLAAEDASYAEVGVALGLTKQAVALRYPNASARPAGGQAARNR